MTLADWNSKDYFVNIPDIVIPPDMRTVDFPFQAKVWIVLNYLLVRVLPEAQKATNDGYAIAGLLVALATIDYLAGYFVGKETTRNDYQSFMCRYFPEKYHPYLEAIYRQLRCGLMHNLVPLNPWRGEGQIDFLIQEKSSIHLTELNGKFNFSVPIFIEDTRRAFIIYQHQLVMHPEENQVLIANFEKRFRRLGGTASAMLQLSD